MQLSLAFLIVAVFKRNSVEIPRFLLLKVAQNSFVIS